MRFRKIRVEDGCVWGKIRETNLENKEKWIEEKSIVVWVMSMGSLMFVGKDEVS